MKKISHLVKAFLFLYILLLYCYCYYIIQFKNVNFTHRSSSSYMFSDETDTKTHKKQYTILYWTGAFSAADFYLGYGKEIFEGCEFSNCYATADRYYLPVDQFDAILFHGREYTSESCDCPSHWDYHSPSKRSQHQRYVYVNLEAPANTPKWNGSDNFYNWTMTYRYDSDVLHAYGRYVNAITNYTMPAIEEIQKRPFKIAWMVSNCNASSHRNDLYRKLNKYIPIDVYGACGTKSCSKEKSEECYNFVEKNYKFYLSFENSICTDYVTEKMYEILMRNLIPIVYGGANYSKIAPPNSVIDVTQFKTIKELAEYIISLDEDPEKYLSYFEWKRKYVVYRNFKPSKCALCKKLNEPIVHKSYDDINQWWSSGNCKYKNDLPQILFN